MMAPLVPIHLDLPKQNIEISGNSTLAAVCSIKSEILKVYDPSFVNHNQLNNYLNLSKILNKNIVQIISAKLL